ncbi:hypothetical protein [Alkaliphilus sp. B6464]|uniref:hypothetical protein n=1 Tax=Alkaliphilus sp. B6464 TaxID=2731219 RepID=UPI001BAB62BB|nr:hypothetical protein [Alkaliphilus sp. B6464]QUH19164.1 hypothetical protein HYG84_04170 [Alkaliphilus sp. B6464]
MKKLLLTLCVVMLIISSVRCSPKRPEISEETLTGSAQLIENYGEIDYAEAFIEKNKLILYLIPVNEEVPKERVREIGVLFLKALSGYTVNEGLKGPTDESYGEIYDYYNTEILVEGENGTIIDKGTKSKGKNEVKWQ